MVRGKRPSEVQSLTKSAQTKDYFSSKYSLKAKAGGNDGLVIGQEIYCLPLMQHGLFEMSTHAVKSRGQQGFKSKFNTYIHCNGVNEETGEYDNTCVCCQLAQQEWDKYVANGKKGETMISFKSSRYYLPILLLGNDTGSKTATNIPVSKLTLSGRDFSFIELSQKGFNELIATFKNDLLNNGRMEYGLEGEALWDELINQLSKHILKISINKPEGFGTHKKHYSFVSFDNKNIGAETNSYRNITEGLTKSAKLQAEVEEFLTLFETELDGILTPWTDEELIAYINGTSSISKAEEMAQTTGYVPKEQTAPIPKSEQVVIEDEVNIGPSEEDEFFDGENVDDITLPDEPTKVAVGANNVVDIDDADLSFEVDGEEEFFGDE